MLRPCRLSTKLFCFASSATTAITGELQDNWQSQLKTEILTCMYCVYINNVQIQSRITPCWSNQTECHLGNIYWRSIAITSKSDIIYGLSPRKISKPISKLFVFTRDSWNKSWKSLSPLSLSIHWQFKKGYKFVWYH